MNLKKRPFGGGMEITLDGDEFATAIYAYLCSHDMNVVGPRTVAASIAGGQPRVARDVTVSVYVDPSGDVYDNRRSPIGTGRYAAMCIPGAADDDADQDSWFVYDHELGVTKATGIGDAGRRLAYKTTREENAREENQQQLATEIANASENAPHMPSSPQVPNARARFRDHLRNGHPKGCRCPVCRTIRD